MSALRNPLSRIVIAAGVTLGVAAAPLTSMATASPAAPRDKELRWETSTVDPDQNFRGLDGVDRRTAWATGESLSDADGKVFRTTNGGTSWQAVGPADTAGLSFRDVEATSAKTASVLAIGPGEASRIYRTTDGGRSWTETFRNRDEAAFFNCMDFYPGNKVGLAVSDPVDGKFRILRTTDSGRSWSVLPDAGMPSSEGEFNFSASGDCLATSGRQAWFGSGGERARVFSSRDLGRTWRADDSGIPAAESGGVFALAFANPRQGVAVGGDFADPTLVDDVASTTRDGRAWKGGGDLTHLGEDAAWLRRTVLVVGEYGGTQGSSISRDGGHTWTRFSEVGFHTIECTRDGACWAAGGNGRVGVLRTR